MASSNSNQDLQGPCLHSPSLLALAPNTKTTSTLMLTHRHEACIGRLPLYALCCQRGVQVSLLMADAHRLAQGAPMWPQLLTLGQLWVYPFLNQSGLNLTFKKISYSADVW